MSRTTKTKEMMYRNCALSRESADAEENTVELSFSSEEPYDRLFGTEVLSHKEGAVNLKRLNDGGPVLLNHDNYNDTQVAVVEKAWLDGDKARAKVRFSKSQKAQEVFADIMDGIRRNVSVGYMVHKFEVEEVDKKTEIYRAVKWEPYEISIVPVPADPTVGVNRTAEREFLTSITGERKMAEEKEVKTKTNNEPVVDLQAVRNDAAKEEKARVREILAYGQQFDRADEASKAIDDGTSIDTFRKFVLDNLPEVTPVETDGELGLSEKETKQFSFLRAINAQANPTDRAAQEAAAFEFEVSRAYSDLVKRQPKGVFVPPEVLARDLTVGTDSAGGYTVATNLLVQNFIELLRNKMVVNQAGATTLPGLVGDVAIPKQTGGATAYWVAESGAPTESAQTFGQLALAPKTVGAFTDLSRKLLIQSAIAIENLVRSDLATVLAIAIDLAALHGTGADNQPTGIAATTGIGSVAGGTNGLAPAWSHIIALETEVAQDNADLGSLGYITNAKVRGVLKGVYTNATYGEIPVWQNGAGAGIGELNGYPAHVTNQVSSALTKGTSSGVCSAIFFGNWADLVIGMWGGVDILVDPYTGSTSGTVRVVALQDIDLGVRHAESFAAMLDALTA